jgi:hypothetical protein
VPASAFDRGADGKFDTRSSSHFVLYQDVDIDETGGFYGTRRFEQQILEDLERAYERLDDLLGLRPPRKIDVVVYDPERFDRQFAGLFRFPAAGFYHGVIRVRGDTMLHEELSRVLRHELVHAALDAAAPSLVYPGWLNEGIAEWFEVRSLGKRGLSTGEIRALAGVKRRTGLIPFAQLAVPSFQHLASGSAQLAYLQSYAMVDYLVRLKGERSLSELCEQLARSRNLDRALRRVYRADLATLEERFLAEMG